MLTDIQIDFLRKVKSGEIKKEDDPHTFNATMERIQKQFDKGFTNLLWVVENCPEIIMDEATEIDDASLERYRRFKALLYITSKLDPISMLETNLGNVELSQILQKLSQLYPKYYFEITNKKYAKKT